MTNVALPLKLTDSEHSGRRCLPSRQPEGFAWCNGCGHFSGAGALTNARRLAISSWVSESRSPSGINDTVDVTRFATRALASTTP
jgi:hypothetical protein